MADFKDKHDAYSNIDRAEAAITDARRFVQDADQLRSVGQGAALIGERSQSALKMLDVATDAINEARVSWRSLRPRDRKGSLRA